jgi:putative acetyltransferase
MAIYRVNTGERVIWGTVNLPFSSPEDAQSWLREVAPGQYILAACANTEAVAWLNLCVLPTPRMHHTARLTMAVRDDWQRKGLGATLLRSALDMTDKWLNVLRVEVAVWTDNEAAMTLYTKYGFVVEGTHRSYAFRGGRYVDAHTMARLRPDHAVSES